MSAPSTSGLSNKVALLCFMKKFFQYDWFTGYLAILLVIEKLTRAYLFQIAREKSCDYL